MHGFANFDKTGNPGGGCELGQQAAMWPTPAVAAADQGVNQPDGKRGQTLLGAASGQNWNCRSNALSCLWTSPKTPTGGPESRASKAKRGAGGESLQYQSQAFQLSPPAPATSAHGEPSSRPRRRLSPLFVEWLMGWPIGWANCACSATELSQYKRRMRSWLSTLIFGE